MRSKWRRRLLPWSRQILNAWRPLRGAGIRVTRIGPDCTSVDVEMKLHWWNRNIVGVHYGGSLFSMTDPFIMLMLMQQLGPEYIVWDKAASIRFRRPGRGTVRAEFRVGPERIVELRAELERAIATQPPEEPRPPRIEPVFAIFIRDGDGHVVAEVQRTIHIQKKQAAVE